MENPIILYPQIHFIAIDALDEDFYNYLIFLR